MASRMRRCLVAIFITAAVSAPLLVVPNAGAARSQAGVVVNHGDDSAEVECVKFSGEEFRAIDLLNKTRFDLYTTGGDFGRCVGYLDGEGHLPPEECFDLTEDAPNWGVWLRKQGQAKPKLAPVGVSSLFVPKNAVLHLVYAPFGGFPDFAPQPRPDKVGLKAICGA